MRDLAARRVIKNLGVQTPLLVPSFSSRGFPEVTQLHAALAPMLTNASLVSAFDLHHGFVANDDIYTSDVLFVDSGCYEASAPPELNDPYPVPASNLEWTPELHHGVVDGLAAFSPVVAVTFDHYAPLSEQCDRADEFADAHNDPAVDFLMKPEVLGAFFDHPKDEQLQRAASFGVLGVTEKELGPSLHERCVSLARLRVALQRLGLDTPIHVFGALDPATVLCYFLCGSDIFDGLTWLRFTLERNVPIYHAHGTILLGEEGRSDSASIAARAIRNATGLVRFQDALADFAESAAFSELSLHLEVADRARDIATSAITEAMQ